MNDMKKMLEACATNAVHIAITTLDTAGLHEVHVDITENKVDPHLEDRLGRLIVLLDATPWPIGFDTKARELRETMRGLSEALKADKLDEAKTLAGRVHGLYHSLVKDFYEKLPEISVKRILTAKE